MTTPTRSDAAASQNKWIFEPHGGYGHSIDGEQMPFGYISEGVGRPLFELNVVLDIPADKLREAALKAAAAPGLLAACNKAFDFLGGLDDASEIRAELLAAILKARGQ